TNDFFAAFNARVQADAAAAGEPVPAPPGAADSGSVVPPDPTTATGGAGLPTWVWIAGGTALAVLAAIALGR
ncbi:MAG: hypothetical protein RL500_1509, partial [Pseudomonadota bacterium]